MIKNDQLIEVLEMTPSACSNITRKAVFDVAINGETFKDVNSALSDTSAIFRLRIVDSFVFVRVKFCFQLLFQVEEVNDQKNGKEVLSIILQRKSKKLAVSSVNNSKQLMVWANDISKLLNQRGFHSRYSAIKKIGKGNFATVYLVNRVQDKKKFAVKSFTKQLFYIEEKGKQSLIREISVIRKFNHKNIIKLQGVYETDHSIYLVLELLQGGLLSERIALKQKSSTFEIKMIMKSLLEGLEALHKQNIMHRDLKPDNVLIRKEKDFECVIADFGLAEYADAESYLFVRCGTPGFVAPQVLNIKDNQTKYTCACDLFSLGIIFHMLLFKRSPFIGKDSKEIMNQNRVCKLNFEDDDYRQLPEQSLNLLRRLLERDPQKRITASEALKHAFFYSEFMIWESNKPPQASSKRENKENIEDNVPLKRATERKKMTHIRGDSCLPFKMKENAMANDEAQEQTFTCIQSPVTLKLEKKGRFKKLVKTQSLDE